MRATVLRGELAEQQSIFIMRTFREMRHYIMQNQQFVTQSKMGLVTAKVSEMFARASISLWCTSKDAGKKICAINKIYDVSMIHPAVERLLKNEDKKIE